MTIKLAGNGTPYIECKNPECGRLHKLRRNKDYSGKKPVRFRCSVCKTSWNATEKEQEQIVAIFANLKENPRRKTQPKKDEKKPSGGSRLARFFDLEDE